MDLRKETHYGKDCTYFFFNFENLERIFQYYIFEDNLEETGCIAFNF